MKKTGDYQIPFDKDGNQMAYAEEWRDGFKFLDNAEFDDTLTLVTYGRGRSSATFTMRCKSTGKTVSVFVSDFTAMAQHADFKAGQITGRFTFTKKGQNYGCKLAEVAA